MEMLLPNVNTSEGCFEIGITISNEVFTEDAINQRKYEPYLLTDGSILSYIALHRLGVFKEE
ncbi:UNVERIFIED_ORG: DicB protein [Citrobacter freundii]|nr:cell division inhibitor [Citrobacter freundii]